ncbi:MAG TPA: DUF4230 domain-containing protein [Polyangia bacterium]|nr:DUF4230 domain-containing protein [Polyangia bacterium]
MKPASEKPRSRRPMIVTYVALILVIFLTGALVAYRGSRAAKAEELQILQGVRRVCKLATVEMSLADYAKKTVPKAVDLPFTKEPEAYLFYAGIVSAGFDICDDKAGITVNHAERQVRITLPPPRILSVDILRFETINETSGFLNSIAPEDRNRWYGEARAALEHGALAQGALDRAQIHAEELFEAFVARHGYTLVIGSGPAKRSPPMGSAAGGTNEGVPAR